MSCLAAVAVAAASLVLVLVGAPASAATDDPAPPSDGASLLAPDGKEASTEVEAGVAAGCSGHLDNVHKSGGTASVHGRTVCIPSTRNFVSLSIGYVGWFGERYAVGGNSNTGSSSTVSSQAKSVCSGLEEQTWRAFGYHSAVIAGTTHYANTSQDGRFSC